MTKSRTEPTDLQQETLEISRTSDSIVNSETNSNFVLEPDAIILDRYRVIKLLGRGGMGSVFHIRHINLNSDYALKVLDTHSNDSTWRRFENEAKAANRLDHPNLIKVHDFGLLPNGQPFFVMELVPGITLSDHLKKNGVLGVSHALSVFIQVAFALSYAHDNGVIHRDLKPSNIMLVENDNGSLYSTVKVVDLGIAKLTGIDEFNQQTLTRTGEIFGSPLYMSPEQCMGTAVDRRTDLYSLGCALYETLTGAPPLMGDSALSTMMKHQSESPLSLKEASLGIIFPKKVEQVVAKLLEKNPDARYLNAQLLTVDLVNIQQTLNESDGDDSNANEVLRNDRAQQKEKFDLFSIRNTLTVLLVLCAYGLGYYTGENTFDREKKQAENVVDNSKVKRRISDAPVLFEKTESPNGYIDDEPAKDADPYMKQGPSFFSTRISNDKRKFTFPKGISLGSVCVIGRPETRTQAMNEVVLPNGPIEYIADAKLMNFPNLMLKFRPGEIYSFVLQDTFRNPKRILNELYRQNKLEILNLNSTFLTDSDISAIGKLPKLNRLFLANSTLSGDVIASLPTLKQMHSLDLVKTQNLDPLLDKLVGTKNLYYLRVKSCALTRKNLLQLAKLTSIGDLHVNANTAITDETLPLLLPLKKLESLNIEDCAITLKSLPTLKKFPLKRIWVGSRQFTEEEKDVLKKELKLKSIIVQRIR